MDYTQLSDEELIQCLRDGDSAIMDFICNKYKPLVRSKAKSMFILGADNEDLIQEGMLGLFKAVRDYDYGRDASFFTFAELCISRQMYTAVQASNRKKHSPLNSYISFYTTSDEKDNTDERSDLMEYVLPDTNSNPEQMVIDQENLEHLEELIEKELSSFEKEVLDLFLTGMAYTEIARILGRDAKSTDNALHRIKCKMKKAINSEE